MKIARTAKNQDCSLMTITPLDNKICQKQVGHKISTKIEVPSAINFRIPRLHQIKI